MRCFDHDTIESHRVPAIVLMDHAGRAVAERVLKRRPTTVIALCGKGNNGADGWLAARWIARQGCDVLALSIVDPATLHSDARTAFEIADLAGVRWSVYRPGALEQQLRGVSRSDTVLIDAVLGTGVSRPLDPDLLQLVREMNRSDAAIVAVDVPTGVNASTGEVMGDAVTAVETVAMAFEKLGTAVTPGAFHAGTVHVADIGIDADVKTLHAMYTTPALFAQQFGRRQASSHKGTYGRCGIWMGDMPGAARLAASSAARSGAGLVIVGGEVDMQLPPDVVVRSGVGVDEAFVDCRSIVIGPGLGNGADDVVATAIDMAASGRVCGVIDADGLRAVGEGGALKSIGGRWVLTPHPKEAGRLLGWTSSEVQAHRVTAAVQLAERTGAIVLLKGYRTIIASPKGHIRVNPTGDASLAVGGSGDVLAGVIGALLAQGLDPFDAASLGAWLHGTAGELAGQLYTQVSTMASDIVECLPKAIAAYLDAIS